MIPGYTNNKDRSIMFYHKHTNYVNTVSRPVPVLRKCKLLLMREKKLVWTNSGYEDIIYRTGTYMHQLFPSVFWREGGRVVD